jgi:hypothetical protein
LTNQDSLEKTFKSKCPTKCNQKTLTNWKSLFSASVALVFATISFIGAFIVWNKLQYKKMNKKYLSVNNNGTGSSNSDDLKGDNIDGSKSIVENGVSSTTTATKNREKIIEKVIN